MRAKVEWVADGTRGWRTRKGVQVYPAPTTTTTDPLLPLFCFRTSPLMDGHVTNTHTHTVNRHTQTHTHTHETWSAATSRSFDSLLRALSSSLHSNFKSATRQFERKIHPHTHTRRTIDAIGLNRTSQSSSQLVLVLLLLLLFSNESEKRKQLNTPPPFNFVLSSIHVIRLPQSAKLKS